MEVSFLLFACSALALLVQGQDQSGFISIDCGNTKGSNYTDKITGITYSLDEGFLDSTVGESKSISAVIRNGYNFEQHLWNVRSFSQGSRNCYTLRPEGGRGNKYLIRASFLYGNYDGQNQPPQFDLYIGADFWETVALDDSSSTWRKEIIHVPFTDYIYVCLVNTDDGTPFISALELRPLNILMYPTTNGSSLSYFRRYDLGSRAEKYQRVRYKDDVYDRMWRPSNWDYSWTLNTTKTIDSNGQGVFQPPSKVMSTAVIPNTSDDSLLFSWDPETPGDQFYIYLYFAELQVLQANETREFNIYLNDELFNADPVVPQYLSPITVYREFPSESSSSNGLELSIRKTSKSTHPPILNAIELYTVTVIQLHSQTDDRDVQAMMSIKSIYGVARNWQGDPCAPPRYVWLGLNCSYNNGVKPARIISLDLSSSGLKGEIAPYISSLTMIQSLDLSNNSLTGQVPSFLAQLTFLKLLNLKGNNFTGSIPAELLVRSKDESLSLSIDEIKGENTNPSQSIPCKKKKKSIVVPVVASAAALCLLLTIISTLWIIKRRKRVVRKVDAEINQKDRSFEVKNRQLTYSEVLRITNNFERVVGKGGFGTVYHGYLGDTQVAVKMLSPSSVQGYKEFEVEAELLTSVRHKNLTSLVGYCKEGTNIGIIYEYMVNGNLRRHLLDRNSTAFSWEERLRIATDAAQGLEYLHHGCKQPIIHRDVKTTNILLNEKFQAKLSDFGLSRVFPTEGGTYVSTMVAGTPGYLDPEYCTSNRLNEKSDVYSFGIVLMEIITSRPPLPEGHDKMHIIEWVSSKLANGDIKGIADARLQGDFDVNSVWKAVELAMTCVFRNSTQRPTMNFVVTELRDCLATEIARHGTESIDSIGVSGGEMSLPMMR